MLETTVHEQLLPDTAVDPTWCWYIRQLNSDIAKLHQNQKSHSRNLRDKKDDLQTGCCDHIPRERGGERTEEEIPKYNSDNTN